MKKTILLLLLGAVTLIACKKDDSEGTTKGGSGIRIHQPTPAGFTYPHTYYEQNRTSEFKAWINGTDVTSKFNYTYFFKAYDPNIPYFQLRLNNPNSIDMVVANQVVATASYFFANDTLFIIDPNEPYEDPFAKGGYSGFTVNQTTIYVSGKDDTQSQSFSTRARQGTSTYQSAMSYAASIGLTHIDTLAYYNSSVSYR